MTFPLRLTALAVLVAVTLAPVRAADLTFGDLLELDEAYVTIADHAVAPVAAGALVAGARRGIAGALRARGIANPQVADVRARADGRGVVPAEERAIALALQRYGARIAPRELIASAIRGELAALHDPYALFFTAADVKGFTRALDGTAEGGALPPPVVEARLLPGAVGYAALRSFPADAAAQLRAAVARLTAQGAQAFVLDLRGNGGGYATAAVHVASLFLADGPVVAMQARRGPRQVTRADGGALPPAPLVVLIDHDSASGAEVVAGALQDRRRATLIGTRSFGKGVAQELFPLPDGAAIKLTTMRYYTAGGRFIDGTGLRPDIAVAEPADAQRGTPGRDPQLDRALAALAASGMIAR